MKCASNSIPGLSLLFYTIPICSLLEFNGFSFACLFMQCCHGGMRHVHIEFIYCCHGDSSDGRHVC